jgi:hypothetical protein
MATKIVAKEDFEALLFSPIVWESASLTYEGDTMVYIGIVAGELTKIKLGSRFRCYYAPSESNKVYRLVLFEVGTYFDKVIKQSFRCYFPLASAEFKEDIWGKV